MRRFVIEGDARQYHRARAGRADVDGDGVVRSVVVVDVDDSIVVVVPPWELLPIVRTSAHDDFQEIRRDVERWHDQRREIANVRRRDLAVERRWSPSQWIRRARR
jgi:hypothetical protein